jgi:hypothetical protein
MGAPRPRSNLLVPVLAVLLGAPWAGSCSLLVDPESLVIKCETTPGTDEDPCIEAGMHCVAGTCQACEGKREDCNGVDDDCDGLIDEGHDQDGDHYTWCGGGIPELADCVPTDPTIHPSPLIATSGDTSSSAGMVAIELCDGKDNDCDGKVDESPECMQSQSCMQTGCLAGQVCDEPSGRCIVPRAVGSGCSGDSECQSGFCVNPSELGSPGDAQAKRCASACCTDNDCSQGTVCAVSSSGLRACLPADIVGRGEVALGMACSRAADCASGLCVSRKCRARCKSDADCTGSGLRCVLGVVGSNGAQAWVCDEASGRGEAGTICTGFDPTGCKSGACDGTTCAAPCGRTSDCKSGTCDAHEVATLVPPAMVFVAMCTANADSSDTLCCTNSDCSPPQLCKPTMAGMHTLMTCQAP